MEATHNINYEGLELEIQGEFEQDEPSVGYKGVVLLGNYYRRRRHFLDA
jgi:hypothetical protein